jgi:hypothetical protein
MLDRLAFRRLAWLSFSREPKGNEQCAVEFAQFVGSQFADVVRQSGFFQAHQSIALNCAFVFEAFGCVHRNLGGQSVPLREYGSADDRGIARIYKWLAADDDKNLAANPQLTPQKFVESMANGYQKRCPSSFSIVGVPTGQISGFEAFSAIVSCGTSPLTGGRTSEAAMILAIKGQQDYYTVQWAERSAPSAAPLTVDRAKWIQRFHALAPIKICPIVPGESPPYTSCVK